MDIYKKWDTRKRVNDEVLYWQEANIVQISLVE